MDLWSWAASALAASTPPPRPTRRCAASRRNGDQASSGPALAPPPSQAPPSPSGVTAPPSSRRPRSSRRQIDPVLCPRALACAERARLLLPVDFTLPIFLRSPHPSFSLVRLSTPCGSRRLFDGTFGAMANMNITGILEKMTGKDKDYRYMATSDLLNELNKESFKADQDLESKLTNIVLQQLEDTSGDVSGLAVKCLAPLVKKASVDRIVEMTDKLCDKLLNGKEQHRDIASIALKTIIVEVTMASLSENILVSLAPQLINGVTNGKSAEIKCECLDILGDVLHRFGNVITKDHAFMLTSLLTQLSSTQPSVTKKSVSCIASLAPCFSDDLLAKATSEVVQLLKNKRAKSDITRPNIQMIGALSWFEVQASREVVEG
ncbi:cullin-associated NEDD8-dissociated protein 1 [Hordeum vulgare]|nr:cullin-associated NEDD8-dissociated protein 1 [Hordeum vulgare]